MEWFITISKWLQFFFLKNLQRFKYDIFLNSTDFLKNSLRMYENYGCKNMSDGCETSEICVTVGTRWLVNGRFGGFVGTTLTLQLINQTLQLQPLCVAEQRGVWEK